MSGPIVRIVKLGVLTRAIDRARRSRRGKPDRVEASYTQVGAWASELSFEAIGAGVLMLNIMNVPVVVVADKDAELIWVQKVEG